MDNYKTDLLKTLDKFATLKAGWDSYGALPINRDSIEHARDLIEMLPDDLSLTTLMVPTGNGGVGFEWEHPNGNGLELEVDAAGRGHYVKADGRIDWHQWEEAIYPLSDTARTLGLVRWVCGA